MTKAVVVGAGIVGISQALLLAQKHQVTVVADKFANETNSVNATAMWHIFLTKIDSKTYKELELAKEDVHLEWAFRTLETLWEWSKVPGSGVEIRHGIELFRNNVPSKWPAWVELAAKAQTNLKHLCRAEIDELNALELANCPHDLVSMLRSNPITYGYRLSVPAANMNAHLAWLFKKAQDAGVDIVQRKLSNIAKAETELSDISPDFIVNCSGLNAQDYSNDQSIIGFRGHYFRYDKGDCGIKEYVGDDQHPLGMTYIVPRFGSLVIGGTAYPTGKQEGEHNWESMQKRLVGKNAHVLQLESRDLTEIICDRPVRVGGVRIGLDKKIPTKSARILHNYGHGGSGWSMSIGCAEAVSTAIDALL